METKGPGDLKLGFKLSLEYPLRHQRCSLKLFFPKSGSKWSPLLTKGQKRRSATQHQGWKKVGNRGTCSRRHFFTFYSTGNHGNMFLQIFNIGKFFREHVPLNYSLQTKFSLILMNFHLWALLWRGKISRCRRHLDSKSPLELLSLCWRLLLETSRIFTVLETSFGEF